MLLLIKIRNECKSCRKVCVRTTFLRMSCVD